MCRPFLSGQVAYSLASEVIGLLHGLVTVPGATEVWSTAIREVKQSHTQSLTLAPYNTVTLTLAHIQHTHRPF